MILASCSAALISRPMSFSRLRPETVAAKTEAAAKGSNPKQPMHPPNSKEHILNIRVNSSFKWNHPDFMLQKALSRFLFGKALLLICFKYANKLRLDNRVRLLFRVFCFPLQFRYRWNIIFGNMRFMIAFSSMRLFGVRSTHSCFRHENSPFQLIFIVFPYTSNTIL